MITFSAPGKIHLLGEHTVVYGKPALLTAINLRLSVTLSPTSQQSIDSELVPLQNALETAIKNKFKIKKIPVYSLNISSKIPIGSGHGSSAALSVAYTGALLEFLKIDWNHQMINEIAYEGERIYHGNPSGGDVAAVTFGGFLWFRKELESIKIIHSIPHRIHQSIEQFFILTSGKPVESTKEMVEKVALLKKQKARKVKNILDDQEELTKEMLIALVDGDHEKLVSVIRQGEKNLEALGVVGKKAQNMVRKIEAIGGACKISGGGGFVDGSGTLIAYHQDSKKLLTLIKKNDWDFLEVTFGSEGLKRKEESV